MDFVVNFQLSFFKLHDANAAICRLCKVWSVVLMQFHLLTRLHTLSAKIHSEDDVFHFPTALIPSNKFYIETSVCLSCWKSDIVRRDESQGPKPSVHTTGCKNTITPPPVSAAMDRPVAGSCDDVYYALSHVRFYCLARRHVNVGMH